MNIAKWSQKIIEWSFLALFALVPLVFSANSFELFEYNKMMLTYGLTAIILGAWITKIICNYQLSIINWRKAIKKTPFDLFIGLYVLSHLISTIFSIDSHVSFWGYYSRFHEGFMATICYVILYYAAVSNLKRVDVFKIFLTSLLAAIIVSLWGILEHNGASPSCYIIAKEWNNKCWVQDVQNRVFATLGQPNWMAAYLDVMIFVALGLIFSAKKIFSGWKQIFYIFSTFLMFVALTYTKSRSGILGLAVGLGVFLLLYVVNNLFNFQIYKRIAGLILTLVIVVFVFGSPIEWIGKYALPALTTAKTIVSDDVKPLPPDINISESSDIRKVVWKGALDVWKRYPVFGSGVETFAYAYYLDRPSEHNLLSEWDFLYNKAHNEFLNILATTGAVGMIAYSSLIGSFIVWTVAKIYKFQVPTSIEIKNASNPEYSSTILISLLAAYVSILVTNFFGFSVVIIGLFFFLFPAFGVLLEKEDDQNQNFQPSEPSFGQWVGISVVGMFLLEIFFVLLTTWSADSNFAMGKNLNALNHTVDAMPYLKKAVERNANEPTFKDEFSYNQAVLAVQLNQALSQQSSASAELLRNYKVPKLDLSVNDLIESAVANSNAVVEKSPNAMPFWKTRTKVFYELSLLDRKFLPVAIQAIKTASELAPTDAKVNYNYGVLLAQTGQIKEAIKILEKTVALKPDYRDPHYYLGLYYAEIDEKAKAKEQMKFILEKIGKDKEAEKWLEENK